MRYAVILFDRKPAMPAPSVAVGRQPRPRAALSIRLRALNLARLFNIRESFRRQDDTLPQRLFSQPATRGPSKGQVVDKVAFEKMRDEYYQCMGWDNNGVPTEDKLEELSIKKNS